MRHFSIGIRQTALMKVETPQVSWHAREPIFSVDFSSSARLATAAADSVIRVRPLPLPLLPARLPP